MNGAQAAGLNIAKSATPASALDSAIARLEGSVDRLRETSYALIERVQPVSTPSEPQTSAQGGQAIDPPHIGESETVRKIEFFTSQIVEVARTLDRAKDRLEV